MMEKNSRIEVGKTPAEDKPGQKARHIVMGTPIHDKLPDENSFEKISHMIHTVPEAEESDSQRKIFPGKKRPAP